MAATKKTTKTQTEPFQRAVSLVWVGLEDTPVGTVNNTICQIHDDLFIMSFGFTNPPVLVGTPTQVKAQIEAVEAVRVTPVARIAVTEQHLESIIKALKSSLTRYRKQKDVE